MRRIIAKAVLSITRDDVQDAAGSLQLCAEQISGIKAAVHAVRNLFECDDTEAVLLVDASNAFNSLNRQVALQKICPSLATVLINTYREPSELFVDGDVLYSREGTTHGDPLAMPMYALATIPLIKKLDKTVHKVWYADDATGVGKMADLRKWWDEICSKGPAYGYFTNASKTWLITKETHHTNAVAAFTGTNVKVTSEGRPHLGAAMSLNNVTSWVKFRSGQMRYAAFTHGFTSKWSYLSRTIPDNYWPTSSTTGGPHTHETPANSNRKTTTK